MPFYEYECTACKFYVEALQKISDPPLKQCPSCKKQTMKRLVSAPVFRLKGGGWYETDFKSEGEEKRNIHGREETAEAKDEGKAKAAEPEKSTEAKTTAETKPAGKAAAKPAARKPAAKAKAPSKAAKRKPASKAKKSRR